MTVTSKSNQAGKARSAGVPRKAIAASLVAVLAFAHGPAFGQAVVHDPIHTIENILTQLKDIQANAVQWGKEYQQWQQTYQHYQQQLADARKMFNPQSVGADLAMQRREADYGIEVCGGDMQGLSIAPAQLLRAFAPDMEGKLADQQREVCGRIVLAENLRYNQTVDMFNRVKAQDAALQRMASYRSDATAQGKIDTSNNDLLAFTANAQAELAYSQTMIGIYDGTIASLREDQQRLARTALAGKAGSGGDALGSVVQGAALKAALDGL